MRHRFDFNTYFWLMMAVQGIAGAVAIAGVVKTLIILAHGALK